MKLVYASPCKHPPLIFGPRITSAHGCLLKTLQYFVSQNATPQNYRTNHHTTVPGVGRPIEIHPQKGLGTGPLVFGYEHRRLDLEEDVVRRVDPIGQDLASLAQVVVRAVTRGWGVGGGKGGRGGGRKRGREGGRGILLVQV